MPSSGPRFFGSRGDEASAAGCIARWSMPGGRLHGVDGVSVIDAWIMPVIPRANTNLPTMMLAERLAARTSS